ncbi:MAG: glycosyltransferase family 4 protein [Pleurocapsa sp. MO_192.B19]|nr:glycosyltransferase family 4 protein [Pleurocapsa sp. MO_192.B19]
MEQHKILFVDHTAVMGGAELSLLDLATAYSQTSKVLLFKDGPLRDRLEKAEVKVSIAQASETMLNLRTSGGLNSLTTVPELWNIAGHMTQEAKGYDLILANSQKAFVTAAIATLRGSPPVLWYLHDILTAKHFSRINRMVAVFLANRFAAKVLVNSQATGKAFVAAGGKEELLEVVYNGFESQKFDIVAIQDIETIRSQLGIGNAPLIGLFSRLSYWKGQHILLDAIKELPQVHVILVGEALFGEQEYVFKLKTLAAMPELAGRVHWLGFRDDIPALMKACDIVAHTSTEPEPFGRVIVEGQLAQKPVIATAAGGALELIEDGINGYLFPPGDAIALRRLIQKLISDRSLAETIAQQGYINAKTNFSLETILVSFTQAIAQCQQS